MGIALSDEVLLAGTLLSIFSIGILLDRVDPSATVLLFGVSIILLWTFRKTYLGGFVSPNANHDLRVMGLLGLFTIASLNVNTGEVVVGLGKAGLSAAHLAGYRFAHALAGLVRS